MQFQNTNGLEEQFRRGLFPEPVAAERDGPVHRIDDVLAELFGLYQNRFPELRATVVQAPVPAW